jgi:hypothetical protein
MPSAVFSSSSVVAPCRVQVERLVSSRYSDGLASSRPQDWDGREAGVDVVEILGGSHIRLLSSPMQSPPKPGWILMLTGGNEGQGFLWTLYGISRQH